MVSFHEALAESPRAKVQAELEASSKKRKWVEPYSGEFFKNHTNIEERKSSFDIELNLETPPHTSDNWRQYLSVKSGKINMCGDSKKSTTEPLPHHHHMSLDLELNLTSESQWKKEVENSYHMIEKQGSGNSLGSTLFELDHDDLIIESNKHKKDSSNGLVNSLSSSSWFSSSNGDHKEMVATVCMKCHMLVMLCKSCPTCPNCKFMHPPDQNPSNFLKRRSSLLY